MTTNLHAWASIYPTARTIEAASLETLQAWDKGLPPPADSFQALLRDRIRERGLFLAGRQLRADGQGGVVDQFNELADLCAKIGLKVPKM